MATLTRGELTAQELLSHEMGLHTEKLSGRIGNHRFKLCCTKIITDKLRERFVG